MFKRIYITRDFDSSRQEVTNEDVIEISTMKPVMLHRKIYKNNTWAFETGIIKHMWITRKGFKRKIKNQKDLEDLELMLPLYSKIEKELKRRNYRMYMFMDKEEQWHFRSIQNIRILNF